MNHDSQGFFERPVVIKSIIIALFVAVVVVSALGLVYEPHGHFDFESWPLFAGILGFVSYSFIVLSAKGLRRILRREEDYYE